MGSHSPTHRYLIVIAGGTRNPLRGAVAKDVTDAILKTRAINGLPATYWTQKEQEVKLDEAYEKWSKHGGVWSAAAPKVSSENILCCGKTTNYWIKKKRLT